MTKAFRGYINYIKDDDEEALKAWEFATYVSCEDLLLTAWQGIRRDLIVTSEATHPTPSNVPPLDHPTTDPAAGPTSIPQAQEPGTAPPPVPTSRPMHRKPSPGQPPRQPGHPSLPARRGRSLPMALKARCGRPDPGLIDSTVIAIDTGGDRKLSHLTTPADPIQDPQDPEGPPTSKPREMLMTGSTSDIRAHFMTVPTHPSMKTKRPRDAQVRSCGEPSLKKLKAIEAIPGLLRNCPWRQGTKRKRTRTLPDGDAARAEEGDALIPDTIVMHVSSEIAMPTPFLTVKRNRETTRAPIAGPSLNLSTITAHGSTASTEPTHLELVPIHPELHDCPAPPTVPVHAIIPSLASLPLGSTTTSTPLNER
jgi:hypothetical protein